MRIYAGSIEVFRMRIDETEVEILIGTEMPDQAPTDKKIAEEILPSDPCMQEDPFSSSANLCSDDAHCMSPIFILLSSDLIKIGSV